jgi:hypothetical protein
MSHGREHNKYKVSLMVHGPRCVVQDWYIRQEEMKEEEKPFGWHSLLRASKRRKQTKIESFD